MVFICYLKMLPNSSDCFRCWLYSYLCNCLFCIIIWSIYIFSSSTLILFNYLFKSLSSLFTRLYSARYTLSVCSLFLRVELFSLLSGFYLIEKILANRLVFRARVFFLINLCSVLVFVNNFNDNCVSFPAHFWAKPMAS